MQLVGKFLDNLNASLEPYVPTLLEITFILIGLQLLHTAICSYRDQTNPNRFGTALFWGLSGITFLGGQFIPPMIIGIIICIMGLLSLFKQVKIGTLPVVDQEKAEARSEKIGNKIFIPVLTLGVVALILGNSLKSFNVLGIGIGAILASIIVLIVTKAKPSEFLSENNRMVQQVSTTGILPQLLAALGAVFAAAGVGDVIASLIGGVVPADSRFFGVVAYVLGMVIFTMIMGNAFAAFTVITAGIGMPFVFALGANPFIAGALAMTAGYCGTLMTPMAGNFNALPAALLQMKNEYGVIKQQIPVAVILIVVHIALMYFLAF
ncbi:DUF979 domain-containing protein [Facklamia miroungae]|uniref:Uncharacterized membrane protein n=1 Tax=Facklamia miroungae TaxID=120956 RepID=A0A1G7SLM0_9LACT|nr:DUF979 domain-containing protein [Facklamia miroungae]NKZ29624.1 DUF979 domain-containing protein [Facklamia miroungae]SDG23339.1 Uncharacterized membrane protein [Facklamia miroungae]